MTGADRLLGDNGGSDLFRGDTTWGFQTGSRGLTSQGERANKNARARYSLTKTWRNNCRQTVLEAGRTDAVSGIAVA